MRSTVVNLHHGQQRSPYRGNTMTDDGDDRAPDSAELLRGLDRQQRLAVTSTAAPLAIIAAAGSGKTTVLTRRIAHRLLTGTADASHVVALTFTRDAAAELKRRLRRLDIRAPVEAGTFHSISLRLLHDHAVRHHRPVPVVANDRLRLLKECLTHLRWDMTPSAAAADLDWARARLVDPSEFAAASRAAGRRPAVPADRFADLHDEYSILKRRRGVVDFDDLLDTVRRIMGADREFADAVRWRFRHFFVDEAQDLNPLQHAVLDAWRGERPDLCVVGDPRQAIFGWNGADPSMLIDIEDRYPGITVIRLSATYRCPPAVVRAASSVLAGTATPDDTVSAVADGPAISVVHCTDETSEAAEVARRVASALHHRAPAEVAVLARTNDQLAVLDRALVAIGVPTVRSVGRSALDVALADAYRQLNRERLAEWAMAAFDHGDEIRRRVAEEADRFLTSNEPGGFRAWIAARNPFDDLVEPTDHAVAVATFHAAKGREWPVVFVTGVEAGLVPHGSAISDAALAEEARLLYVAITRSGSQVVISTAAVRDGRTTSQSPWLDGIVESGSADQPVAPPAPCAANTSRQDPLAALRAWRHGLARLSGVDDRAVCSDRVLQSLLDHPVADTDELAARLGVSISAARRLPPPPRVA
jgi:DNA helicase-2/ATP-dependent DNA helicase PcrA